MKDYGLVYAEGEKKGKPVEYFRLYDLRHTLLTRLGKKDHSATVITAIAGWSSTGMALRYVHHDLEDKARAIYCNLEPSCSCSTLKGHTAKKGRELPGLLIFARGLLVLLP